MAALFACTKCHSRHPFEELSQAEQLCKECRNNFPVVKCTYCRAEFQQEDKSNTNSICKKCAQNVKLYGKPTVCEYCNILAAFIGSKCQRCANSERKWGVPSTCEQCKQRCAFDRTDGTRTKVDGKLLCWLCTLAYKRALEKARRRKDDDRKSLGSLRVSSGSVQKSESKAEKLFDSIVGKSSKTEGDSANSMSSRHSNSSQGDRASNDSDKGAGSDEQENTGAKNDKTPTKSHHDHKRHHHHHHHHHHHKHKDHRRSHSKSKTHKSSNQSDTPTNTPPKKARLDLPSANGMTPTKREDTESETPTNNSEQNNGRYSFLKVSSSFSMSLSSSLSMLNTGSEKSVDDPHSSEHLIALQQLQEQLDSSKKQLQAKDQQMLEKDKKINELKAQQYETEKDFRTKIQSLQKQHSDAIEGLQIKNRELMKQVASLSKGKGNINS